MRELAGRAATFGRNVFEHVQEDDALGLSAELAYRFFLALFPFAIFLTSLGAFIARSLDVQNPGEQAVNLLTQVLPEQAARLVGDELSSVVEQQGAGILSFGAIAALFFATGGTNALIKAMNRAYNVGETRPIWRRYLLALGMTLLAGSALIAAFILLVGGQVVGTEIASQFGLAEETWMAITLLRWPVIIALLVIAVAVLYRLAPNIRLPFRWIVPGALLFTIGWLAATLAFGIYVSNFGNYGATYGTLAGVAILLIWFYLTGFLLILGVEVNEVLARMAEPEEMEARRHETGGAQASERGEDGKQRKAA